MNLRDLFSLDDMLTLVELADGQEHSDVEVEEETFDLDALSAMPDGIAKAQFMLETGGVEKRLIAKFADGKMRLILDSEGELSLQNWSGCRFRLKNALKAYELVLRRMRPELFKEEKD